MFQRNKNNQFKEKEEWKKGGREGGRDEWTGRVGEKDKHMVFKKKKKSMWF